MGKPNLDDWLPKQPRSIKCFEILGSIATGAICEVHKAKDKQTGEIVALKEILMCDLQYVDVKAVMREIRILRTFDHKNVIPLKEILTSSDFLQDIDKDEQGNPVGYNYTGRIYLVLEYMDHTLEGLLSHRDAPFPASHVKCYMKQLLDGLCYCHANRVLHRDIKGQNILINNEGSLKLADFSLSRWRPSDDSNEPNKDNTKLTSEVTSLWYRPPELLLQTKEDCDYVTSIDMWSVGCVFTKLLGQQVMEGENKAGFYIPNP